jgi:phenylpropionate dioxygenase-like ring-hydroxylating dioxygenase large terminal subunit
MGQELNTMHAVHKNTVRTALSREQYLSQAIYEAELKKIHCRQWLLVGHISLLKNPGDYYVKQVGPESLIIARDSSQRVRAYFNVCRHRGFRICQANETGNAKRLTCPYHAWTYSVDGSLVAAPGYKNGEDADFSEYGLHEAWCEIHYGFIFVCLSRERPVSLASQLAPICNDDALRLVDPERMKMVHRETYIINANWKTVVENDSECYHCGVAHPALSVACDYQRFYKDKRTGAHFPLRSEMKTFSTDGDWVCSKRLGTPQPEQFSTGFLLFPLFAGPVFFADHCVSLETTPLAVDRTQLISEWYVHEDAVAGVDYNIERLIRVFHETNIEDARLMERNYAGVRSMRFVPGPLSANREDGTIAFLNLYEEMMRAA